MLTAKSPQALPCTSSAAGSLHLLGQLAVVDRSRSACRAGRSLTIPLLSSTRVGRVARAPAPWLVSSGVRAAISHWWLRNEPPNARLEEAVGQDVLRAHPCGAGTCRSAALGSCRSPGSGRPRRSRWCSGPAGRRRSGTAPGRSGARGRGCSRPAHRVPFGTPLGANTPGAGQVLSVGLDEASIANGLLAKWLVEAVGRCRWQVVAGCGGLVRLTSFCSRQEYGVPSCATWVCCAAVASRAAVDALAVDAAPAAVEVVEGVVLLVDHHEVLEAAGQARRRAAGAGLLRAAAPRLAGRGGGACAGDGGSCGDERPRHDRGRTGELRPCPTRS